MCRIMSDTDMDKKKTSCRREIAKDFFYRTHEYTQ